MPNNGLLAVRCNMVPPSQNIPIRVIVAQTNETARSVLNNIACRIILPPGARLCTGQVADSNRRFNVNTNILKEWSREWRTTTFLFRQVMSSILSNV